jgi:hypothetical protein
MVKTCNGLLSSTNVKGSYNQRHEVCDSSLESEKNGEAIAMIELRLILITALAALTANAQQTSSQPASPETETVPSWCFVTPRPATEFTPPADDSEKLPKDLFYIGSEKLWTVITEPMIWHWRPHRPGHELDPTEKIFWYRVGYKARKEPIPKLRVTGRRLDGPAPALVTPQGPATNAIMGSQNAMLTGVYVPTPGCWEITGDYEGDRLSFVVWVEPANSAQP